jgi:hypothetical protein
MLDIGITDYYSVNKEPGVSMRLRYRLAAELLRFAEADHLIRLEKAAEWCMRYARKAVEDGFHDVPPSMRVDVAVRRALSCFSLTSEGAVQAAEVRRQTYLEALRSIPPGESLEAGIPGAQSKELLRIESMLPSVLWFVNAISDTDLSDEVQAWFAIRPQLRLGEDIIKRLRP